MTVATNALLEGEGARTVLVATEGFEDVVELGPPGARRPLPAVRGAPGAARAAGAAASARRERMGPDGPLRALEPTTRRGRASTRSPTLEPEAVAVVPAARLPPPRARARARRGARRAAARRARLALARGRRHVPRVRARRHHRGRRRALPPAAPPTCAGSSSAPARPGCPSRPSCSPAAGWPTLAQRRRARRADRALAAPPAARPARRWAAPRRRRAATCCASTWAAPRATSAWSHGGAVRETARARGRRAPARAADARHPHRRRRRRLDRLARRGRRAARRAALGGRRARARLLRPRRRREPTVTDANLLLGLLARTRRWPAGSSSTASAAERAVGALGRRSSASSRASCAEGIVRVANAEMLRRAARDDRRARHRPARLRAAAPSAAPGRCTRPRSPTSSASTRILCPRASGVLARARARRRRAPPRRRSAACCCAATSSPTSARASARDARASARAALGGADAACASLRAALPRPVVRAGRRGATTTPTRPSCARRSHAAHEERYGYRDAEAEVELVTLRVAATEPGPDVDAARRRRGAAAPSARRARRLRRRASARRACSRGEPRAGHRDRRARRSSSCPRPRSPCRPAGRRGARVTARSGWSDAMSARPDRAAGASPARCAPPARRWAPC